MIKNPDKASILCIRQHAELFCPFTTDHVLVSKNNNSSTAGFLNKSLCDLSSFLVFVLVKQKESSQTDICKSLFILQRSLEK